MKLRAADVAPQCTLDNMLLSDEGKTVMWTLSTRQCEKNVDDICFPAQTSGAIPSKTQVYQLFITKTALEGGSENVARAFLKWLHFLKPPTALLPQPPWQP